MSENASRTIRVAASEELQEGKALVVQVEGRTVALFRVEGRCYAIANACPHRGGPLAQGEVKGHVVTCPWHGWTWDVRTGANVRIPALKKVECFAVTEADGEILIDVG